MKQIIAFESTVRDFRIQYPAAVNSIKVEAPYVVNVIAVTHDGNNHYIEYELHNTEGD